MTAFAMKCENFIKILKRSKVSVMTSKRLWDAATRMESSSHLELKSSEKVMEAQTKILAAQASAITIQSFPPLPMFTGEVQSEYDEFDHWRSSRRGPTLFPGQMSTSLATWEDTS